MAGISKSETLNRLSEKTGLTKKQVGQFLDELAALAYKEARSGFTIPGVGKLVIVDRNGLISHAVTVLRTKPREKRRRQPTSRDRTSVTG